jgi:ferric-dicitrate binding protein FerR (iron transport regulator)
MDNFALILKKHFQKESSAKEEKLVSRFKEKNPYEYNIYKHLWNSNAVIAVREYDVNAAWLKVLEAKKHKNISIYTRIRKIAAVAAILVIGLISAYIINQKVIHRDILAIAGNMEKAKEIVLSDGSKVWLNRNARLSYPNKFGDKVRNVHLDGEAYFDIAKNPDKPFLIKTNHSEVTVLGTSFNINTNSKITEISVTTGKVNVKSIYSGESIDLLPQYTASISKETIHKSATKNINNISWKTGKFIFKETPLEEVVNDLNSFYDKQIVIKNQNDKCSFTADFDNVKLSDIIEILSLSCNLKIVNNQNVYEIY